MSELSLEIVSRFFRENFHPEEVTVMVGDRNDTPNYGYKITLVENQSRRTKQFLTGPSTTISDLQDMAITAAKLFGYTWSHDSYKGEAA
jgi:hypothetical protein